MGFISITKIKTIDKYLNACFVLIIFLLSSTLYAQTTSDDYNNLGLNELEHLKPKSAIKYFDKAIELDSTNETAYYNRASTYYELNKFELSIKDYEKLITFKTLDNQIYFGMARCYVGLKENDKALTSFAKSIELDPKSASSYVERAMLKIKMKDQIGACSDLKIANEIKYDVEIRAKLDEFCK